MLDTTLHLAVRPAPPEPSPNVLHVAAMFGLGLDQDQDLTLIPPTPLTLVPHQVIFVTGPSGSGKSTILRLIETAATADPRAHLLRFDNLPPLPNHPLVDALGNHPLDRTLRWLSLAGLNDAFVMLRRPSELSDGQRHRLRLAQAMSIIETAPANQFTILLADEFCATLDRLTAAVLARNVRRWVSRTPVCFVAATTHDDLLEHLEPDILIEKHLGDRLDFAKR